MQNRSIESEVLYRSKFPVRSETRELYISRRRRRAYLQESVITPFHHVWIESHFQALYTALPLGIDQQFLDILRCEQRSNRHLQPPQSRKHLQQIDQELCIFSPSFDHYRSNTLFQSSISRSCRTKRLSGLPTLTLSCYSEMSPEVRS